MDSLAEPAPVGARALFSEFNFPRFWTARAGTMMAYQMMTVAVAWQIYHVTGSAFDLGLVGLVGFIPRLLLTLHAGQLADHGDRRRIVAACQLLEALAVGLLLAATLGGWVGRELILAVVFVSGAARTFEMPTNQALLPGLVREEALPTAVALSSAAVQGASIVGPAVGGLLYALGAEVVFSVAMAIYLVASLLTLSLRPEPRDGAAVGRDWNEMLAGIRFIRSRPVLLGAISLDLFAVLLGGATALMPIFAKDILHAGPGVLGLLNAAPAVGALAMSVWLVRHPLERGVGRLMFAAVAVFGVATLVFGLSRWLPLSLLALAVLGAADMVSVVVRQTLVQLDTPDVLRGRVSAVNFIFIGASNQLGEFESGLTAALLGPVGAVLLGGAGTLVVVALWMSWFPALRHRERLLEGR